MITGIILLAVIAFVGVISYRRPRLELQVFKNVPLINWMYILVLPIAAYIAVVLIVKNVLERPQLQILDFEELYLIAFSVLLLIYGFVGTSIHFVGKVLSRYIPNNKHALTYQVNEMFHGKLSHYMIYLCCLLLLFTLGLLEINHPLPYTLPGIAWPTIVSSGVVLGVSSSKSIFHTHAWFGGYNRPLFFLTGLLLVLLFVLYSVFGLELSFYPVNLFISVLFSSLLAAFVTRQILIFTRLNSKKKLKFLTKLLSA